jgi:protein gp37
MTKEEIAELIDKMPQDMDVNDFIHELVNRALSVKRKWVGFTQEEVKNLILSFDWRAPVEHFVASLEAQLKEKNCG